MLNYTKRYINFLAFAITILILIVLIILDFFNILDIFNIPKYPNNVKNQIEIEKNSIDIQSAYIELSKIVFDSRLTEDNKKTEIQESKKELKEEMHQENERIKEADDKEKIGNIDIYSTNKWRIKIPKLDLDAPITEGTSQESLRRTVGHFEQTDKWKGNVALAGHNRGYRCNFFQEIKTLKKGDKIIYSTEKGSREYKVVVNKVIEETDWTYIQDTEDNRITLITCEAGKKEYRRCIQAIET